MSILGTLLVELKANTASFVEGMVRASETAAKVGEAIEDRFAHLGAFADTALKPFGEFGTFVGETLRDIGEASAVAIKHFGGLRGEVSALSVGLGVTVGAMQAITVGAAAMASSTSDEIAKMAELAQSSGISIEALSGLSFVFKQTGVDLEQGVKGLEKLDKSLLKAATSAPGMVNGFTRLGIAVRDSSGNVRDAEPVLGDLAEKFAAMKDGAVKTGLAMDLFGKGGAALIPMLNRGRDGIQEMLETAKALGLVLDKETASASLKFKEDLGTIEAAGKGAAIRLTKDLLPALDFLAAKLVEAFKTNQAQKLIDALAWIAKATLGVGDTFYSVFHQWWEGGEMFAAVTAKIIEGLKLITEFSYSPWKVFDKGFRDKAANLASGIVGDIKKFDSESRQIWKDNADFINGVFSTTPPKGPNIGGGGGHVDTSKDQDTTLDRIRERIKALLQEADDWAKVASAGTQAEQLIAEAVKKGNAEYGKLKAEAAKDKFQTGRATAYVEQNKTAIEAAVAEGVFGQAIKSLTGDLDKQSEKLAEHGRATPAVAEAYRAGGSAIASAALDQKFAAENAKLNVLVESYGLAVAKWGAASPIVKELGDAIQKLTSELAANKAAEAASLTADLEAALAKQNYELKQAAPFVEQLNKAYFESEDAVRAARIELELYNWAQQQQANGVTITDALLEEKRKILTETEKAAYDSSLAQSGAQFDLNRIYDEQVVKLQRVREQLQQRGADTLLIDSRIADAEQEVAKRWDEAALNVGNFGQKTRAVLNEIVIEGQDAAKKIAEAFLNAYNGITDQLAKLLTGQKTNFKQVFQGLAEQITKAEIQKLGGSILEKFGIKLPGVKADGSSANPYHVVVDQRGSLVPGGAGGAGGLLGGLPSFLNLGASSSGPGTQGGALSDILGSGGVGDLGALFGGFFAAGGDVEAGKILGVGEKGPELFVPRTPGTIIPSDQIGGKRQQTSIVNNFNGFKDSDMFRRSTNQLAAHIHRQMSIAYARS